MNRLARMIAVGVAVCARSADAQTFTALVQFTGTGGTASGAVPTGSLTLSGTTLYGMTSQGSANGEGNVFSVGTGGTGYQNLVSFTGGGGTASGDGNIFSVGIDGSGYQNLYSFSGGNDGGFPQGDLTLSGGTLFGMTSRDGINGDGTLFAFTLQATPVPEPGTLALVGALCAAGCAWRRRRVINREVKTVTLSARCCSDSELPYL